MGQVIISGGAGGGVTSDEVTVTANRVVKGYTYVGSDTDDEIGTGTLELSGTAVASNVESGTTFYNTDPLTKVTGSLPNISTKTSITYTTDNSTPVVVGDNAFMASNSDGTSRLCIRYTGEKAVVQNNTLFGYPASNFGDVAASNVLSGKYFTSVNGIKVKGTMTVNSLTSFKVAVSSGRNVTLTWTVPTAATGKPYSGIHVRYKTGSAPTSTSDGTAIYTNVGSATTSGSTSTATVTMPSLATTYYFSAWSYATINNSKTYSSSYKTASCTTGSSTTKTFNSSTTFTVQGYTKMDVFCVGGGGAGGSKYSGKYIHGGGGGGGCTKTVTGYTVSNGQVLTITVGAGGSVTSAANADGGTGGTSSVKIGSTTVCTADGGTGGAGAHTSNSKGFGGSGGSGGGPMYSNGGTNGGDGSLYSSGYGTAGTGQGTTTRAYGASSGTAYSGGGGGGGTLTYTHEDDSSAHESSTTRVGSGGSYGGGKGAVLESDVASGFHHIWSIISQPVAGTANSGGGGGGGVAYYDSDYGRWYTNGGKGGSGIVMIKLY